MRRLGAVLHIFSLDMLLFGQTLRMPLGLPRWLWTASLIYRLAPTASAQACCGCSARSYRHGVGPPLLVLTPALWKA